MMIRPIGRFLLKLSPALFFVLICLRVMQGTSENDRVSLANTLNSLHRSQKQSVNDAFVQATPPDFNNTSASDANTTKSLTEPDDPRPWFDARPRLGPVVDGVEKLKTHPHFRGFAIESPAICRDQKVDILVYLHSAPGNRQHRHAIRQTWAASTTFVDITVKHIFILGIPDDKELQMRVKSEASAYGDIVQGNFTDTFQNLTLKALTMLGWVSKNCPQARYIVKVDDDMIVDMFRVVTDIVPKLYDKKYALACHYRTNLKITRDPKNKWFIDPKYLPGQDILPPFCSGYFVTFTGNLVPVMLQESFKDKASFPVDDVYLFGTLLQDIKDIKFIDILDNISIQTRADPVQELKANGKFQFIVFAASNEKQHLTVWRQRYTKLSAWENKHSGYVKNILDAGKETLVVN